MSASESGVPKTEYAELPIIQNNSLIAYKTPYIGTGRFLADILQYPSENALQGILECLAMCESGNREWVVNPNDKGSPSFGLYQFKFSTWQKFCEGNIMNRNDQEVCARQMIANGGIRHWYNCAVKCGVIDK
jgi:hypothetical protein